MEFRIRGVKTNIPFLQRLLTHEVFIRGSTWTTFIDDSPDLFRLVGSKNRAQFILKYLGDVIVNGSSIKGQIVSKNDALISKERFIIFFNTFFLKYSLNKLINLCMCVFKNKYFLNIKYC